ncbi:MAG: DUF6020 family protein [Lachnospiraceae bacterium]|nr:DUF6020 family protein [Lachnospiraceae bacterium]
MRKIFDRALIKKIILILFFSVFAFAGLVKTFSDAGMGTSLLSLRSAARFSCILFLETITALLFLKDGDEGKKVLRYAIIYGSLLGIATDAGCQFKSGLATAPGIKGKAMILVTGVLLSFLFLPVTYRLFRFIAGMYRVKSHEVPDARKCRIAFIVFLAVIQACWFPAFLAYYPAIMSYDFNRQFGEAVSGYQWFFEYQPLIHTFLIRMFYLLGTKMGSVAGGMAAFALLQSLVLSASVSACLVYIYKKTGRAPACFWLAAFSLLPFNPVLAISMTKDILFTAFFAFMILILVKMREKMNAGLVICFFAVGILNILFRNNAAYALLFLVPAFLLAFRDMRKRLLTAFMAVLMIVCGLGTKTFIRNAMDAIPGSEIEMYSVPIVQMVRVIKYQQDNLTPEQWQILADHITDFCWGEYNPSIADGPKGNVALYNAQAWEGDKIDLLRDYLTIGLAYPNDYIDAWIGLTIGYWFMDDVTHAEMLGAGDDTDLGLLYTFNASACSAYPDGIESHSYLPGLRNMYSHIVNGNSYYDWPVISLFMKPAFYLWLFVLAIFACIYRRNKTGILVLTYPVFYFLTMLLGPCVNFRYMYPFVVIVPVLIAMALSENGSGIPASEPETVKEEKEDDK